MSNYIKNNTLAIAVMGLLTACTIYTPPDDHVINTNHSAIEEFSYTLSAGSQDKLYLENVNGSVCVKGTSGNLIKVSGARIVESDSKTDASEHLDQLQVVITTHETHILVETRQPDDSEGRNYRVDYEISLPQNWNVSVNNLNGIVCTDSLSGETWINLLNGNIFIEHAEGNVYTQLTNGNIEATVTLPVEGICDMRTVNGNVVLNIPRSTDAEMSASITNGNIVVEDISVSYLSQSRYQVNGVLGDGSGTIRLNTINGSILVRGE